MRRLVPIFLVVLSCSGANAFAERHSLIVLSQGDRTVYDIDAVSGQVLKQLKLAGTPQEAVISWDEQSLFVSSPDAGYVFIVDLATFRERGRLESEYFKNSAAGGSGPLGLATDGNGKLYVGVAGALVTFDSRMAIYNPEHKQAVGRIELPAKDVGYFKIQGTTDKLYHAHRRDNQVVVVNTLTDTVVKSVPVPGGPVDVAFLPGNEVWVLSADGTIAVIDSGADVVKQVITTKGKGAGRITVAPDLRFVAATHSETGETTILHPLTKAVINTIKVGQGPSAPAFAPAAKQVQRFLPLDPTDTLYVAGGGSEIALVDLSAVSVTKRHTVGEGLVGAVIHYTWHQGWIAPRATARRLLETDLFTLYQNAMFLYDVSPIHEHRADMSGIFTGTGMAKMGCWDPKCPPDVIPRGTGGLPYNNLEGRAGTYTNISRGTLHQEEGGSPSPRRMMTFELKNNYYRQTAPKRSVLEKNSRLRKMGENPRVTAWEITMLPGDKPLEFPDGDFAVVYLGGGLLRVVRNGVPEVVERFFNDYDWRPYAHSVESLTHPVWMAILEFR